MSRRLAPCGTVAAWQRHRKLGEPACEACSEANAAASRARGRAMSRLARRYPGEFQRFLAEARANEPTLQYEDARGGPA